MMKDYMKIRFYRKNIAWMYIIVLVVGTVISLAIPKQELASANDPVVIPEEAIRLRILANSDSDEDQAVKRAVRDAVNAEITKWVEELTSLEDARDIITSNLDEVEKIAQQELDKRGITYSVNVEFGDVQFPTKLYGQFLYPAGIYEAILITLGDGSGANWWCVLFPPLCFVDFSTGLAVSPGFESQAHAAELEEESTKEDNIVEKKDEKDSQDVEKKEEQASQTVDEKPSTEDKVEKSSTKPTKRVDKKPKKVESVEKESKPSIKDKEKEQEQQENVDKPEEKQPTFVEEKEEEVEVKFFLVELFKKFF
ncbi:stage II sporulation protein R [Lederbergia graminis]|uniref:Stage II sporulation protein R n=1 Tax=Lederbergia graminis TaxID=735518 RepID=A0ABW0LPN0_9BACI